ncbi:MAG: hypothetical protein K8S21_11195 [Gemmatimonadetes bacterium]|nr:hypothetical protein [Gemmatimonadota bacterium]
MPAVWRPSTSRRIARSDDGNAAFAVDMTKGAVAVTPRQVLGTTADRVLETNAIDRMFDVSPDGRRFLVVRRCMLTQCLKWFPILRHTRQP